MRRQIKIDRIRIRNYRSIQECDVHLSQLTFLVGPNASGKSNFIDAIYFVATALNHSLGKAVSDRKGIHSILYGRTRYPSKFGIELEMSCSDDLTYRYSFEVVTESAGAFGVAREECMVEDPKAANTHYFLVHDGGVQGSLPVLPAPSRDRLFLVSASGSPEFRDVYDFLSGMVLTEPIPKSLFVLANDSNPTSETTLPARFQNLRQNHPDRANTVEEYLRAVAPPFHRLDVVETGGRLWLQFFEKSGAAESRPFYMSQISSGLLNATDLLLYLLMPPEKGKSASVVLVEEPEAFLHPGAIRVMRDGFLEATHSRQVIVTSHSPDLLDDPAILPEWILMVSRDDKGTHIGPIDSGTASVLKDRLFTAGELLRQGGFTANV